MKINQNLTQLYLNILLVSKKKKNKTKIKSNFLQNYFDMRNWTVKTGKFNQGTGSHSDASPPPCSPFLASGGVGEKLL